MTNANRRRKDKAHDIGDSSPGTTGDSHGTFHDQMGGGPTFDPDAESTMSEAETNRYLGLNSSKNQSKTKEQKKNSKKGREQQQESNQESEKESTRMYYAKRYGDSWPLERQKRFLREHDMSAREMGWKLKE